MPSSQVKDNSATVSGGGIYSTSSTMKMRGGTKITGNRARDEGGGMLVQLPTVLEQFEVSPNSGVNQIPAVRGTSLYCIP